MRLARASLVKLFLLASATTAHAECAWVLWSERTSAEGASPAWTVQAGFHSPSQCRNGAWKAAGYTDRVPRPVITQTARGPSVVTGRRDGESTTTYICIPDTIDPRAKQ